PAENPPPAPTPPSPPEPLSYEVKLTGIVGDVIQGALQIRAAGLVSVEYAIGDQAALPAANGTILATILPNGTSTLHLTYHWADGAVTTSALRVTRPTAVSVPVELEHTSGPTPTSETSAPGAGAGASGWAQARPLLLLTAVLFGIGVIIAVRRSRGR
ncbi:MAG: hypothetical protein WDA16_05435, partial [Candidatus Thermoplasmatota archaeon]